MRQSALTLIATVKPQQAEPLKALLVARREPLKEALRNVGTIHYARWVVIDEKNDNNMSFPAQLVLSTNFDGDHNEQIEALVKCLGSALDDIYSFCENYSPNSKANYLRSLRVKEAAFYQGSPGRTVQTIAQEKALRHRIVGIINSRNWNGQSAKAIHQQIQKEVFADPTFEWAKTPIRTPKVNWFGLVLVGIVLLILLPFILLWALFIQLFYENRDQHGTMTPNDVSDELMAEMVKDEDFYYQNQFSQIIDMKPGAARLFTVNILYYLTSILVKLLFVEGTLMGIPTIHFARWVMVNKGKRMLFFSNFDGSWTQYLGDFIDKSGWGLTGIFGNTVGFPKSMMLIFRGAYDERHFLGWSRSTQIATQVWYVADTTQSIKNVNDNTIVRNLLSQSLSEKQAQQFLAKL